VRTLRIFWFLICFIPHAVFADAFPPSPADAAKTREVETQAQKMGILGEIAVNTPTTVDAILQASAIKVDAMIQSCIAKTEIANTLCLESSSPALGSFMANYGLMLQTAGQAVKGLSEQCSEISKLLDLSSLAIGAFQVTCATAQSNCSSTCGNIEPAAAAYLTAASKGSSPNPESPHYGTHRQNARDIQALTKNSLKICGSYSVSVASAIGGVVLALTGMKQAQNCKEKTAATNNGDQCTDPKNPAYNQKGCMCTRNELPAAECQNQVIGQSASKAPKIQTGGKVILDKDGNPVPEFSPAEKADPLADTDSGSGGLPGAPSGSGGGASASGGGGGGAQDGFAGGGRRLNTNILGGGSGGSGGGAGFGSGPGYGEDASLKAYKPGGDKDPSRTIASQLAKEVTGQGGRSNWEKVKSRYIDNTGKLLGK